MKIKEKLTRAEQKYILWKSAKIRKEFSDSDDDFTASILINYLVLSVILQPDTPEQVDKETTPFGTIEILKREYVEKFLDEKGIDDLNKEIKFFEDLLNEAPCLFFLREIGRTGSGSGYGGNSQDTDAKDVTP